MIEADAARFAALRRLANRHRDLVAIKALVSHQSDSPNSLDNVLAKTAIPRDFELLSVDIDGFDYHVWANTEHYRPIIVIIEIDSSVPPGLERIADGTALTTFSAMLNLGIAKGYQLVAHTGNLFFVREDLSGRIGISDHELRHPETLFVDDWLNPAPLRTWLRKAKYMTAQRAVVKLTNLLRS